MKAKSILAVSFALSSLALGACTGQETPPVEEAAEAEPALPERLAFMAGHVEAGIALYRAGAGPAGGPHLLHPVSESYADEREGLDGIGFDPAPFEAVSAALEAGKPAAEIEPQLALVEANLAEMRSKAGGEPEALIAYLMDMIREEYAIGVQDGAVTDAGEYQDAWGFATVARQLASDPATPNGEMVRSEIDALIALWPADAPIPPEQPAPPADVESQIERVSKALLLEADGES